MNHIELTGRLTRDPEINVEHTPRTNFTVAVDRFTKTDADKADFFRCVAFGSSAQTIHDCFYKGRGITVSGRMENNPYDDRNGNKHDSWSVIVERWEFPLSDPKNSEHGKNGASTNGPNPDSFEDVNEDVPF